MSHDLTVRLIGDFEQEKSSRGNWEWQWQELNDLVLPLRNFTDTPAVGEKRTSKIYDATAVWANQQLASGLHSFLTNPTLKWFGLRHPNDRIDKREDVQLWLAETRNAMLTELTSARSNFHPEAHELYQDLGAFGTSPMFIGGTADGVVFNTRPLGEVYIRENSQGFVDTIFRLYRLTVRQALQELRSGQFQILPDDIIATAEKDLGKFFTFLHVITPREDYAPISQRAPALRKRFGSYHIAFDKKVMVGEKGFDSFPYVVPRWSKVAGETYGRSAAMSVLPDIKMLQQMSLTTIKAAQKVVDPPLMMPDDGFLGPAITIPAGMNYFRATSKNRIEPLETKGRIDIGLEMMDQRRTVILRAFFLDLFQLKEGPAMTATEVLQRREERLRLMAPMISRLQSEFLSPLIDRVFDLMMARRLLPEPPPDIRGTDLEIDFVSPAALAQRTSDMENFARWLNMNLPLLELAPGEAKNIDVKEIMRGSARLLNIPPAFLRPLKKVAEMEEAEQKQVEAQQAMGQMNQMADIAQKSAKAESLEDVT